MSPLDSPPADRVVITGMGILCAIAADVPSFTRALRQGSSGIEPDPCGEEGPPFGAFIRRFSLSAALGARYALPPSLLESAERAVRRAPFSIQAATAVALEAWERADLHDAPVPPDRLGLVVAGNNLTGHYGEAMRPTFERNPLYLPPRFTLHVQDTDHVGTLSEILRITGEGFCVGGASASGNLGIIHGSRLVRLGGVDACLVIGALTQLSAMEVQGYLNAGAMACRLSPEEDRAVGSPFDRSHRGFVPGQGCGALILESVRSAVRRGAPVLAEVVGHAAKLDGHRLTEPSEDGEAAVMERAIGAAGLEPRQVAYVNAHGSGSPLGDETEMRALRRVFDHASGQPWINATKALTGHCLSAAGVIEAVATVIQMRDGFVHPNPALQDSIEPACRLVGTRVESATIPFALSNSFGFGGINTSVLLAAPAGRDLADP